MSPLSLRRYRAERLLRDEFERRRDRVLAIVRGRLEARGVALARADLEACYAQAWQGLYAATLAGGEIDNPAGWLVLVTHRRALDEHRARERSGRAGGEPGPGAAPGGSGADGPDGDGGLATALDQRIRLRSWLEGVRRLDAREREAAALCYLQGLTRAEAAAHMGLSVRRMRKLMEGRPGHAGVAAKVGALAETVRAGAWCEEQGSLMRALAYGLLAPDGERRRLAEMHSRSCPACRAYVMSLRGLAAAMPPVFVPLIAGTGAGSGAASAAGAGAKGATSGAAGAGAKTGSVAGAAGGGWGALGVPLGMKLAAGCVLAVGVGAGCVAIGLHGHAPPRRPLAHATPAPPRAAGRTAEPARELAPVASLASRTRTPAPSPASVGSVTATRAPARASAAQPSAATRDFTPEQGG